ncbi:MAG: flavodoxin family protein [Candidatus Hermodarchaeota archaeon]
MKSIIIYNTMSGNTEELANKMKDILEKNGHQVDIFRDKEIKSQIKEQENYFKPYDLLILGSCTHAGAPAMSFKSVVKLIGKKNLENKKLICFGTSGSPTMWKKTCKSIKKRVPELEHIGDVGCSMRENEEAVKNFEELIKKL